MKTLKIRPELEKLGRDGSDAKICLFPQSLLFSTSSLRLLLEHLLLQSLLSSQETEVEIHVCGLRGIHINR